jgi:hydrogenase maturation protein HypF
MVEHGLEEPVVGVCCDGVGYGTDGAAWGCEIMACDAVDFERLAHLEYFPLVGGDAAAIHTWRPAAAMLARAYGPEWREHLPPVFDRVRKEELDTFESAMAADVNAPLTSSLGRVFDAVSFMLDLCDRNDEEAQAAIALESAASKRSVEPYPYGTTTCNGSFQLSLSPMVRAIVQDLQANRSIGTMAARFHETAARMLSASAVMGSSISGVPTIVVSGGCFANRRLLHRFTELVETRGLTVRAPARVSCGDAGLALGQAAVAAAKHQRAQSCA